MHVRRRSWKLLVLTDWKTEMLMQYCGILAASCGGNNKLLSAAIWLEAKHRPRNAICFQSSLHWSRYAWSMFNKHYLKTGDQAPVLHEDSF